MNSSDDVATIQHHIYLAIMPAWKDDTELLSMVSVKRTSKKTHIENTEDIIEAMEYSPISIVTIIEAKEDPPTIWLKKMTRSMVISILFLMINGS